MFEFWAVETKTSNSRCNLLFCKSKVTSHIPNMIYFFIYVSSCPTAYIPRVQLLFNVTIPRDRPVIYKSIKTCEYIWLYTWDKAEGEQLSLLWRKKKKVMSSSGEDVMVTSRMRECSKVMMMTMRKLMVTHGYQSVITHLNVHKIHLLNLPTAEHARLFILHETMITYKNASACRMIVY